MSVSDLDHHGWVETKRNRLVLLFPRNTVGNVGVCQLKGLRFVATGGGTHLEELAPLCGDGNGR